MYLENMIAYINSKMPEGLPCLISGETPNEVVDSIIYQYKKLSLDRGKTEPNYKCHHCGGHNLTLLSYELTSSHSMLQYRCKDCGIEFIVDDVENWETST